MRKNASMPTITELIISFIFITIDKQVIRMYNNLYIRIKKGDLINEQDCEKVRGS